MWDSPGLSEFGEDRYVWTQNGILPKIREFSQMLKKLKKAVQRFFFKQNQPEKHNQNRPKRQRRRSPRIEVCQISNRRPAMAKLNPGPNGPEMFKIVPTLMCIPIFIEMEELKCL